MEAVIDPDSDVETERMCCICVQVKLITAFDKVHGGNGRRWHRCRKCTYGGKTYKKPVSDKTFTIMQGSILSIYDCLRAIRTKGCPIDRNELCEILHRSYCGSCAEIKVASIRNKILARQGKPPEKSPPMQPCHNTYENKLRALERMKQHMRLMGMNVMICPVDNPDVVSGGGTNLGTEIWIEDVAYWEMVIDRLLERKAGKPFRLTLRRRPVRKADPAIINDLMGRPAITGRHILSAMRDNKLRNNAVISAVQS